MRVVHVVTRSQRRGAEVAAIELADELDALGHDNELHAIALAFDGGAVDLLPALVPTTRLDARAVALGAWRLRRLLSRTPADVVVAHGFRAAFTAAVATPRTSVRVWQRISGFSIERWGRARRTGLRCVARRFDAVVALTPALEVEIRKLGYAGPVWTIPNARRPGRFTGADREAAAATLRMSTGVGTDIPLVGFVGHLVDEKDPMVAVDVAAEVRGRGVPMHLVIAGDGPLRAQLEQHIAGRSLSDAVTLLGHRDDPEMVYAGVGLTLITSRAEGMPGVAIEAHMAECPVVSFSVGSVADVVLDGITGFVVPGHDASAMADRVVALLRDPERRREMGAAAARRGASFDAATTSATYATRFTDLLAARGPAARSTARWR